jgi:MFS family permease
MIASVAVLANLFVAPASFLQNDYLKDVRGFSGLGISVFTFATAMPSALALALGGRLADTLGRRRLLAVCMPASTALLVTSFSIGGPLMWMSALGGGLCAGLAYPAFIIYRAELFPTGARSGTNGVVMALSLAGSALGLWYVGHLVDRGWQYGSAMAIVAVGQFAAAAIAAIAYPETARRELEDLNPQDR